MILPTCGSMVLTTVCSFKHCHLLSHVIYTSTLQNFLHLLKQPQCTSHCFSYRTCVNALYFHVSFSVFLLYTHLLNRQCFYLPKLTYFNMSYAETCSKGMYLEQSNKTCKMCPIGTFQESNTSANVFACIQCDVNKTTLIDGAPSRTYCICK